MRQKSLDQATIQVFSSVLRGASHALGDKLTQFPEASPSLAWIEMLADHHMLGSRLLRLLWGARSQTRSPQLESLAAMLLPSHLHALESHSLYGEHLTQLSQALTERRIDVITLKGWGLAQSYYAHPHDRDFSDLDLLFRPSDRKGVDRLLLEKGYLPVAGAGKKWAANLQKAEYSWSGNPRIRVECHFSLGYGLYELNGYFERSRKLSLSALSGLSVRRLGVQDEYLFLVYHLAIQHRFQKLSWLLDLAQIHRGEWSRSPDWETDWAQIRQRASKMGLRRALEFSNYFLGSYAGIDELKPAGRRRSLDRWFEMICLGRMENSVLKKARLRAMMQGGWLQLFKYVAARRAGSAELE